MPGVQQSDKLVPDPEHEEVCQQLLFEELFAPAIGHDIFQDLDTAAEVVLCNIAFLQFKLGVEPPFCG